jgi:uncharacterized OsmC-like protein
MSATVKVSMVRNDSKRLRVGAIDVTLHPTLDQDVDISHCLEVFEDYCVVTQSVRQGVPVTVRVETGETTTPSDVVH